MKTYEVEIEKVWYTTINVTVEACDEDQAFDLALEESSDYGCTDFEGEDVSMTIRSSSERQKGGTEYE